MTVLLPRSEWADTAALVSSVAVAVRCDTGTELKTLLNVTLFREILPEKSRWHVRKTPQPRVELTLTKVVPGRWDELLGSPFSGQVGMDWKRYLSLDDELDEEERQSGKRGGYAQGALAKSIDNYFVGQRAKAMTENTPPDLNDLMKEAEREQVRTGGDISTIMQQLYDGARREQDLLRTREAVEDAWASEGEGERQAAHKRRKVRQALKMGSRTSGADPYGAKSEHDWRSPKVEL